ncbi:single-strand binding protein/Primosomal replication protein n [Pseudopedobacter saltans DSM 12145]|uniref:Single-stranded DNA-binding protein n=1 Tax=Pseudopedobacter saltans (strain ATCC 51119 / DSM 12145 / JCM 21818 / CCUG 39354 / LMG 10337 / NBRC 100064 / NCIMB 13643) TaxID=762903 RepID=F0SA65_PSESL|nr:single-stranded DNA-binding protein [Pseudopedobacter saltans]ADY53629.1 single-strand binding protein/Primosomal replication protein n [Pseudopedobacter saltans DSM 12145]
MENVINKVILSGFTGTDVNVKDFGKNKRMARVSLAVNESYRTTNGEEVKKTQWFTLIFWNAKATLAEEQIKKGTKLTVEGRLNNNIFEAKDGTKRYTTDIVVDDITLETSRK